MSQTVGKTRLAYTRTWHHISLATSGPLGRTASAIAQVLMGKHKPTHDPSADDGDYVVATQCRALTVTGKKRDQKMYYTHTTRPGSLKSMSLAKLMDKWGGAEVLRRAVNGMLPKNRLRKLRLARLKAFEGDAHPFGENVVRFGGKPVWDRLPVLQRAPRVDGGRGRRRAAPSVLDEPRVKEVLQEARK